MKLLVDSHHITEIDAEDLFLFLQYEWRIIRAKDDKPYVETKNFVALSRLILGLTNPYDQADHIDGDTLNNKRNNLRVLCNRANSQNNSLYRAGKRTSKYFGVTKSGKYWRARTWTKEKGHISIGSADTEEAAARLYDDYMIKNFEASKRGFLNFEPPQIT